MDGFWVIIAQHPENCEYLSALTRPDAPVVFKPDYVHSVNPRLARDIDLPKAEGEARQAGTLPFGEVRQNQNVSIHGYTLTHRSELVYVTFPHA